MNKLMFFIQGLLFSLALLFAQVVYSASSVMIWPIDPVLEDQDNSTALWLENQYTEAVYLQVRIFAWRQTNYEDVYEEQQDITVSPPFTLIEPGKRQLIRLVKNTPVPAGQEKAYRILIDEIPRADEKKKPNEAGAGIDFKMRYSVPLFSTGKGVWTKQDFNNPRDLAEASAPVLTYKVVQSQGKKWLEIKNTGPVHARISKLVGNNSRLAVDGLVGYALANSTIRLWLPNKAAISNGGRIQASINNFEKPMVIQSGR